MSKKNDLAHAGGLRYVGAGAYIMGVPARDLSPAEAERHAEAIRQVADAGQVLYEPAPTQQTPAGVKEDNHGA